jgi:hypothetical protein
MQELDLSGLQLGSAQWCALLESVSRCSGLRVLSIKGCSLGGLGASVGVCALTVLQQQQTGGRSHMLCVLARDLCRC